MKYYVLASGSKGNCTLVEYKGHHFLIDCGVSKKYIVEKLNEINKSFDQIEALLVTHEHGDHIKGIKYFAHLPIYSLKETYPHATHYLMSNDRINLFGLEIDILGLSHDKKNVGFVINSDIKKLVYVTDTGYVNEKLKPILRNADYYIIESNHDVEMLMQTRRPFPLKQRILSDKGHLSNVDSCRLLNEVIGNNTKEIVFAHISEEANTFELVESCAKQHIELLNKVKYRFAKQFEILCGGTYNEKE